MNIKSIFFLIIFGCIVLENSAWPSKSSLSGDAVTGADPLALNAEQKSKIQKDHLEKLLNTTIHMMNHPPANTAHTPSNIGTITDKSI